MRKEEFLFVSGTNLWVEIALICIDMNWVTGVHSRQGVSLHHSVQTSSGDPLGILSTRFP